MPLEQVWCASAALKRKRQATSLPLDRCLAHAQTRDASVDCNYTYEVLGAMFGAQQDRGNNISTTALLTPCVRQTVLERSVSYTNSLDKLWPAFLGTIAHRVLEGSMAPDAYGEERFWAPWGDDYVSCSPDLVVPSKGLLYDYKGKFKKGWREVGVFNRPEPEHALQLQLNRWIIDHAVGVGPEDKLPGKTTLTATGKTKTYVANPAWADPTDLKPKEWSELVIVYISEDRPVLMPVQKQPGGKGTRYVPDIWSDKEVEDFVAPRYDALQRGLVNYPHEVPAIPPEFGYWEPPHGFPCSWCSVVSECKRLKIEEGR